MIGFDVSMGLVSEYSDEGYIGIQLDGFGGENAGLVPFEQATPFGFVSRPMDAEDGIGSLLLRVWDGTSGGYAIQLHDARYVELAPQMSKGSSCQYNAGGAFFVLDNDDETGTLYIPIDGGESAHLVLVGKDSNGAPTIELRHAEGMSISMLDGKVVISDGSYSWISLGSDGITQSGNLKLVGGLDVGGSGATPVAMHAGVMALLASFASGIGAQTSPVTGVQVAAAMTAAIGALGVSAASTLARAK